MINRKVYRKLIDTIDKRWIGNRQIDNRGRDRLPDGQMIGREKEMTDMIVGQMTVGEMKRLRLDEK